MPLFSRSRRKPTREAPVAAPTGAGGAKPPAHDPSLEPEILRIGTELVTRARKHRAGVLSGAFWSDKLLAWTMKDDAFKVQLFRFVDALPVLRDPEQIHDLLVASLSQPGVTLPPGLSLALKAGGLVKGASSRAIVSRIGAMAEKFIAGRDVEAAASVLAKLRERGIAFSLDLLGEACVSRDEAEADRRRYLDLIEALPGLVASWPADERLDRDHLGPVARANVSIKITALDADVDPIDAEHVIDRLESALAELLEAAARRNVLVNFDMEQHELKELTLSLFKRCCERYDFPAGIAMQAYLRSGDDDARRMIEWSKSIGRRITVRLVKGAYWDRETIHAELMGWPSPVWSRKAETDACFERMTRAFIEGAPRTPGEGGATLALGSHNARSIACGLALVERNGLPPSAIEIQMLHGMADELKAAAVEMGVRVREYVPIGEMIPGMAYLVRRLLENTSNESWLRAGFHDKAPIGVLLASPHGSAAACDDADERARLAAERPLPTAAHPGTAGARPFSNEPPRDFAREDVRARFIAAIAHTPPTAGRRTDRGELDPEHAVAAANAALPAWRSASALARANVLVRAAERLRSRRDELAALVIREAGHTWRDADREVCAAIDWCELHAREELPPSPRSIALAVANPEEPLSGLARLASAALVAGSAVILVPAAGAERAAAEIFESLCAGGCPENVLQLVRGGDDVLRALSHLAEEEVSSSGRAAIVVDASADLDQAVLGVRRSAFGFQGQRRASCGRAIVVETSYTTFLERLCGATQTLRIGDPVDPGVDVGPVLDRTARERIESAIALGRTEARLALALALPPTGNLAPGREYVAPHVFAEVPPGAHVATAPIFGPVLAVVRASSFDEALDLAAGAGAAGLYSRHPVHIARARSALGMVNLHINRPTTDVRVGRRLDGEALPSFVAPRRIGEEAAQR